MLFQFQKNSLSSLLSEKVHRLFATGLFQKIENDEKLILKLKTRSSESAYLGRHKILQLQDLKGAYCLLLSTIVLLIEIAARHYFLKSNVTVNVK